MYSLFFIMSDVALTYSFANTMAGSLRLFKALWHRQWSAMAQVKAVFELQCVARLYPDTVTVLQMDVTALWLKWVFWFGWRVLTYVCGRTSSPANCK